MRAAAKTLLCCVFGALLVANAGRTNFFGLVACTDRAWSFPVWWRAGLRREAAAPLPAQAARGPSRCFGGNRCGQHLWHVTTGRTVVTRSGPDISEPLEASSPKQGPTQMKELLRFAAPALGISIANPLMSNIDNAFVGRMAGTEALAAMSPGTILSDYVLYLFIFLPRATINLVARALARGGHSEAREEMGRALGVAALIGAFLTCVYVFATPALLNVMGVAQELRGVAGAYTRIRGAVVCATFMQMVALSGLLATRDSLTPLKVVLSAAALNFIGDWLFCIWPFRFGAAGAAFATAASTLAGFALMLRALRFKGMLPRIRRLSFAELTPLLDFARPLLVIILARFLGLTAMALVAGSLGTKHQAAYQILVNMLVLLGLCGEPISQSAQAMLPQLLDAGDAGTAAVARATLKNLAVLAAGTAVTVGAASFLVLWFASVSFTSDPAVAALVRSCTMVTVCISSLIVAQLMDGLLLASRDFKFIIPVTTATCALQLVFLWLVARFRWGLGCVFFSIAFRYWVFIVAGAARVLLGNGPLGAALQDRPPCGE